MTKITEYKTEYSLGDKVKFNFGGENYKGVVSHVWIKNGTRDDEAVTYDILSNGLHFQRPETSLAPYSDLEEITFNTFVGNGTRFKFDGHDLAWSIVDENPEEEGETFSTESGNDFSIFRHYEDDEDGDPLIHIELSENDVWSKEDVWELVAELLNAVDEIDKYTESKPPIVINIDGKFDNPELVESVRKMIYDAFKRENTSPRYVV